MPQSELTEHANQRAAKPTHVVPIIKSHLQTFIGMEDISKLNQSDFHMTEFPNTNFQGSQHPIF